jgi:hypothetical protein
VPPALDRVETSQVAGIHRPSNPRYASQLEVTDTVDDCTGRLRSLATSASAIVA